MKKVPAPSDTNHGSVSDAASPIESAMGLRDMPCRHKFGANPEGMHVMLMDCSWRFISKDMDPAVLEAMCTIAGGEVVNRGGRQQ